MFSNFLTDAIFKIMGFKNKENMNVSLLVVGLGNPGPDYEYTRHNCGFMVVDEFVRSCDSVDSFNICDAEVSLVKLSNGVVIASAKPQTFMNNSGLSVAPLLDKFDLTPSDLLVIVDDFNLSLGRMRFRKQGSDGGHNGLKSISGQIGRDFPRLRVGIGPLPENQSIIDFVLGKFLPEENERLREVISRATSAVKEYCENGIDSAMLKFN